MTEQDRQQINLILTRLDADNDDHWTSEGLPRLDVVNELAGTKLTRKNLTDMAPLFTRQGIIDAREEKQPGASPNVAAETVPEKPPTTGDQMPGQDGNVDPVPDAKSEVVIWNRFINCDKSDPQAVRAVEADMRQLSSDLAKEISTVRERLDQVEYLITLIDRHIKDSFMDHEENMNDIQRYLEQQKESTAARAEAHQTLLKGIDPAKLNPKAPIDQALNNRNRNRAGKRPEFPQKAAR